MLTLQALGGGLELALACHYRVGTPKVAVAFPEARRLDGALLCLAVRLEQLKQGWRSFAEGEFCARQQVVLCPSCALWGTMHVSSFFGCSIPERLFAGQLGYPARSPRNAAGPSCRLLAGRHAHDPPGATHAGSSGATWCEPPGCVTGKCNVGHIM